MFASSPRPELLVAFGVAFLVGVLLWLLLLALLQRVPRELSGRVVGSPLVGSLGRVAVTIPERGVGAVWVGVAGKLVRLPARNLDPSVIVFDAPVVVVEVERRLVWVSPLDREMKEMTQC